MKNIKKINRYELTEDIEKEFVPKIKKFIDEIEENDNVFELLSLDLSDTKLNPCTLGILLEHLGYRKESVFNSSFELDFGAIYRRDRYKPIVILSCGNTFELTLSELDVSFY